MHMGQYFFRKLTNLFYINVNFFERKKALREDMANIGVNTINKSDIGKLAFYSAVISVIIFSQLLLLTSVNR